MIYFVKRADGVIKIGYTKRLHVRLSKLEAEHGKLEVLGIMEGDVQAEKTLHVRFTDVLVEGREWFSDCEQIRELIAKETTLDLNSATRYVNVQMSDVVADALLLLKHKYHVSSLTEAVEKLIADECPDIYAMAQRRVQQLKAMKQR